MHSSHVKAECALPQSSIQRQAREIKKIQVLWRHQLAEVVTAETEGKSAGETWLRIFTGEQNHILLYGSSTGLRGKHAFRCCSSPWLNEWCKRSTSCTQPAHLIFQPAPIKVGFWTCMLTSCPGVWPRRSVWSLQGDRDAWPTSWQPPSRLGIR